METVYTQAMKFLQSKGGLSVTSQCKNFIACVYAGVLFYAQGRSLEMHIQGNDQLANVPGFPYLVKKSASYIVVWL